MIKAALVLEGGSLRSLYTAGVLDVFMENDIEFECVIGVSAGALCGANYIAKHIGNSAKINILHSNDPNFFGVRNFLLKGSVFNFDYLFNKPIRELYPYDEERFKNSKQKFFIGATDSGTGDVVYFQKHDYSGLTNALEASSSIPLMCKPVKIDGLLCTDGAVAEPIGINKAISEGYEKIVLVLTRQLDYRIQAPTALEKIFLRIYNKKYPRLMETIRKRHDKYNVLMKEIAKLKEEKKIIVISPTCKIEIKSIERDARKLFKMYFLGRDNVREILPQISEYLK